MATARKIAFLDRDGTLIIEPADQQVDRLDKVALVPGVIPALQRLIDGGFELVMITNQDGLGTDSFPEQDFRLVQEFVLALFASQGIEFLEVFVCPHTPADACLCRKPKPGHLGDFFDRIETDRAASIVVGDRKTDLELGANIGVPAVRIDPDHPQSWATIVRELVDQPRTAAVKRETRETKIRVEVDLDLSLIHI